MAGAADPTSTPSPSPSPTPAPSRADLCQKSSSGLYCVYTVQPGDTLSAIALEFGLRGSPGLSAAEMLAQSNKPDVVNSDQIVPGQKLRIPAASGIIHTVFSAETLQEVAQDYAVTTESIRALGVNAIADPDLLVAGQEFIVPSPAKLPDPAAGSGAPAAEPAASATPQPTDTATATPEPSETPAPEPEAPAAVASEATNTPEATATPRPTRTPRPTATPSRRTPTPAPRSAGSGGLFAWPASGPISSYFGPSHPLGIDIDFFADPNQAVKAAAAGTVTFAGGDPCCSYGYYVIVDHGNGYATLYAHLSRISVSVGQRVSQGQVLGLGGRTGYATGNHLHFEVHKNGAVVDPLAYLP